MAEGRAIATASSSQDVFVDCRAADSDGGEGLHPAWQVKNLPHVLLVTNQKPGHEFPKVGLVPTGHSTPSSAGRNRPYVTAAD